jgi:hypothetical protein
MCEDCGCGQTEPIGEITHYYGKPMVAVVRCDAPVRNGDTIQVKGSTTDFLMTVVGMRNEAEQEIEEAKPGETVAFRTPEKARPGDKIFLSKREVTSEEN